MTTLSHWPHRGAGSARPAAIRLSAIEAGHDSTSPAVRVISEPSSVMIGSARSCRMRIRSNPLSSEAGSGGGAGEDAPVARSGKASIWRILSSSSNSGSSQLLLAGEFTAAGVGWDFVSSCSTNSVSGSCPPTHGVLGISKPEPRSRAFHETSCLYFSTRCPTPEW